MAVENEPRVIKRYANRKLYDMQESCYITHDEIASLVKSGEDVQIIDNRTKEDLTTLTLTQILFREEKMQRKTLPLQTLRGLLQSGGDFIQRQITDPLQSLRDEAGETVRTISHVFRREGEDDPLNPHVVQEQVGEAAGSVPTQSGFPPLNGPAGPPLDEDGEEGRHPAAAMREWVDNTQRSFETFQRTFEERWNLTFNALALLNESRLRIEQLEDRVAALEAQLADEKREEAKG